MTRTLLLGSIGVLAETSDLQRRAFNRAFAEAGLSWIWSKPDYADMLAQSGGQDRVARYAASRGEQVDAAAIHLAKSHHFQDLLRSEGAVARPGVRSTLAAADRVGLVTTTSPENVGTLLAALAPDVRMNQFEVVIDRSQVSAVKPDPEAYHLALTRMRLLPRDVVAVEDNPPGAAAARAAGIKVIAFPGAMHEGADFGPVHATVTRLVLDNQANAA
ncbi:MAG: HAD-IA family hydrolase [Pseudomonadota bacterium]